MKNEKQLKENGFKLAMTRHNGVKIYCKFIGFEDNVQYYYCFPNGEIIDNSSTVITYAQLQMFESIKNVLDNQ